MHNNNNNIFIGTLRHTCTHVCKEMHKKYQIVFISFNILISTSCSKK